LGAENKSKDKLNENSFSILKEKCLLSLFKLKKQKDERYLNLLNRELSTIKDMNYVDYFLVFGDVVDHLKEKKIAVGPGRGSSVSSLVVYLLGITSIDPIENKLLFERFLNRKRDVLPDIDLDVENQDAVFEYLKEKYGSDKIARFTAKKKFGLKTSIKELSAVFGKEATEKVGRIITFSDKEELGEIKVDSIKKAYPDLITAAESMKNLYYDTAIHPSGIIISKKKIISSDIPLKKENGIFISLLSSENLQILGLKKFDFLSLRDTLELISFVKSHLES
jgi:DNA polymerase-3 subunit alpha